MAGENDAGAAGGAEVGGAAGLLDGGNGGGADMGGNGGGNPGGGAPADLTWLGDGLDDETKGYVANKGWKSPAEMLEGYKNLEKFRGNSLTLPKGPDDVEGLNKVYTALGRPETPEGYELGALQAADPEFAKVASGWLHEAGASKAAALALADKWNAYVESTVAAQQQAFTVQSQNDMAALRTEWGDAFSAETENFRRAVATFGMERDEVTQFEQALGTKRTVSLLAKIGKALGEDSFFEGEGNRSFAMTPDMAKARIAALQRDKEWTAKLMSGDVQAREEWNRLNKIVGAAAEAAA